MYSYQMAPSETTGWKENRKPKHVNDPPTGIHAKTARELIHAIAQHQARKAGEKQYCIVAWNGEEMGVFDA